MRKWKGAWPWAGISRELTPWKGQSRGLEGNAGGKSAPPGLLGFSRSCWGINQDSHGFPNPSTDTVACCPGLLHFLSLPKGRKEPTSHMAISALGTVGSRICG